MKNAILIAVMVLFATTTLCAMTIDAVSERNTIYNQPKKISKTFGKLPASGEYGVFINITCRAEKGESEHETLFYHLSSGVEKESKSLYTMVAGKRIMLAEEKWYGWKTADGIKIQHSMERTPYPTFKVWVEVEGALNNSKK